LVVSEYKGLEQLATEFLERTLDRWYLNIITAAIFCYHGNRL